MTINTITEKSPIKELLKDIKLVDRGMGEFISRHLGIIDIDRGGISTVTVKREQLLYRSIFRHFIADQGVARNNIIAGPKNKRKSVKSENRAFIANRSALIIAARDSSLKRLNDYRKDLGNDSELTQNEQDFNEKLLKQANKEFKFQKILTYDISSLKLIDNAGQADIVLNEVALKMIEISDLLSKIYINSKILPFRIGGDEFSFTVESNDQNEVNQILEYLNTKAISVKFGSIKTTYVTLSSEGNETNRYEGPIKIKNGKPVDDSRPEATDEDKESEIRSLLYDLILAEINLIPDKGHIDSALEDVDSQEGEDLTQKFNNYFLLRWSHISDVETRTPDFKDSKTVPEKEIKDEVGRLCAIFPGLDILFKLASRTDESHYQDLKANLRGDSFYTRATLQFISKYMSDPVLGEKVYTKHAFDQLVDYNQLSGLLVFKQVIKGINDRLGLTNGDKVIKEFYDSIKIKIPTDLIPYIVFGRGQADIIIGFNNQAIEKLSDTQAKEIINEINAFIDEIQKMDSFKCQLKKGSTVLNFKINVGVGASKLDLDSTTRALKPPEMRQCFEMAEVDYHLKYIQEMSKWNISELSEILFNWADKSSDTVKQICNSDPNLWNLAIMLNDPKRAVLNSFKLLNIFKNNINSPRLKSIPRSQKDLLLKILKLYSKKVEIRVDIRKLNEEIAELQIDGWDLLKRLKKGLIESQLSQLEMSLTQNNKLCEEFLRNNQNLNQA